jgi:hypothetical protein
MKILLFTVLLLALVSCSVTRQYSTEGFTIQGNTVYYQGDAMAELEGVEFALDDRKFVREMTFKLLNGSHNDKINHLIAYLHQQHPDYEIEVEIDIEHYKEVE